MTQFNNNPICLNPLKFYETDIQIECRKTIKISIQIPYEIKDNGENDIEETMNMAEKIAEEYTHHCVGEFSTMEKGDIDYPHNECILGCSLLNVETKII